MSSFEELLAQTQNQSQYDLIYNALLELVIDRSNHYNLYNRLHPFLPHVNDGGNLSTLCTQLQNPSNNDLIYKSLVHNVVNASKSDEKLKKVLEVVIG